jgi:hypothetical protein
MINTQLVRLGLPTILLALLSLPAAAQSFRVQCPTSTITHPTAANNNAEPLYTGPTTLVSTVSSDPTTPNQPVAGYLVPSTASGATPANGAIKCQQVSGGDGYATMGDGTQTYMFSFGPLSGLADLANGQPATQFPSVFNSVNSAVVPGDPASSDGVAANSWTTFPLSTSGFTWNGAVGLAPDADAIAEGLCTAPCLDGHVDPRPIIDVGAMNGNIPAPLMAIDEDD